MPSSNNNILTKYDKITYDGVEITDISYDVSISSNIKDNPLYYTRYRIKDFETPEFIALKFYDDPNYVWVIFLMNNIRDPLFEWPMNQREFEEFIYDKYDDPFAIHHHEKDGYIVHPDFLDNPEDHEVTNYTYEEELNEAKREIKILKPDLLDTVEKNINDLFRS